MSMIVVSNRLPFVLKRDENGALTRQSSAGGLVTAMAPVVREHKGIWIGWSGMKLEENEQVPEETPTHPDGSGAPGNDSTAIPSSQIRPVNIETELFDDYYNGCCNASFWPLLHSMPDRAIFKRRYWTGYSNVNALFAEETFNALTSMIGKAGSGGGGGGGTPPTPTLPPLIWIHDYQLMLVPGLLRNMIEEHNIDGARIAFFLHIPFPSWDIFRLFPWDDQVLVGMLGCDLIGFHIESYAENFLECCQKRLGLRVDKERNIVEHDGRTVTVMAFPIGIPFAQFEAMAHSSEAETGCTLLSPTQPLTAPSSSSPSQASGSAPSPTGEQQPQRLIKLVLGVDRLDYTKGILNRVKAFEILLENYPEHLEKVLLLQVAVPSRTDVQEYQELKDELDREIGRINGRFSTSKWSPIRYIYRSMKQEELAAFYRDAFVALVTPIRDGMNLVAKEFVACQIREPGVLILSPFTGAGETMHEALLVNPLEEQILAEAINSALVMPLDERELRMSALRRRERTYDIHYWVRSFLKATGAFTGGLGGGGGLGTTQFEPLTIQHFQKWLGAYVGNSKLALLLDYDGTLCPVTSHPNEAKLPEETRKILERMASVRELFIAVITGRTINNIKVLVGIDGITYAANHGLEIEHPDGTKFIHPDQQKFTLLIDALKEELDKEVCKEGAWVETKGVMLTYHYRNVATEKRPSMMSSATAIMLKHGFRPTKSHCAIEAHPPITWDKGRASIHVLRTTFGVDWSERVRIIYVGDDTTDEYAIRALRGMAVTFRITNSGTLTTAASHRLHNTRSVYTLLQWVEQHFKKRRESADESAAALAGSGGSHSRLGSL